MATRNLGPKYDLVIGKNRGCFEMLLQTRRPEFGAQEEVSSQHYRWGSIDIAERLLAIVHNKYIG